MKIKFFAIYIAAGVAFLAFSLWVFLSKGKNAKAVRAKYRMGGIMLTASSMLAASACQCSPTVTCYEPAQPPEIMCYDVAVETDLVTVSVKDKTDMNAKTGDILQIKVASPTFKEYGCEIEDKAQTPNLLQSQNFTVPEDTASEVDFELKLATGAYKGEATVTVYCIYKDEELGSTFQRPLNGPFVINIQ